MDASGCYYHACEIKQVRAIKDAEGTDVDDLSFKRGDVFQIERKDGAGWAYGRMPDASCGWFPLDCVELLHDNVIAEIGTNTGETALDVFIHQLGDKANLQPSAVRNIKRENNLRSNSLNEFLASRPVIDKLVEKNILPSTETVQQVEAAQKQLLKAQKKGKRERADAIIQKLKSGWLPEDYLGVITDELIDRLILQVIAIMPLTKQKYKFTSYEDVFTGATLIQHLKVAACQLGISHLQPDGLMILCHSLLDRNVIFDVRKPFGGKGFKLKHIYQSQIAQTEYSVLNLDKIATSPAANPVELSTNLLAQIIDVMKMHLPDFDALKRSVELRRFALATTQLQRVSLLGLSLEDQKIFYINLYNMMILFSHAKFTHPKTNTDRRYLYEHTSVYTNKQRLSIQDIEKEALLFATKVDPFVYFCLSDCTKTTPATFVFSKANFNQTKIYAIRHFLQKNLVLDFNNYEIRAPKMMQRVWKNLYFTKEGLVEFIRPYLAKEQRDELAKLDEIGAKIDIKFLDYDYSPSYVFDVNYENNNA